jgi:DNA-binding CsgD family transcriptional regulator
MELAWMNTVRWLRQRARHIAERVILDAASESWTTRGRLAPRERELWDHLCAGLKPADAAIEMGVSRSAVYTMLQRFKTKGKVPKM